MTKIQIELPDTTAKAALEAGLLTPQALDRLLTEALRRQTYDAACNENGGQFQEEMNSSCCGHGLCPRGSPDSSLLRLPVTRISVAS